MRWKMEPRRRDPLAGLLSVAALVAGCGADASPVDSPVAHDIPVLRSLPCYVGLAAVDDEETVLLQLHTAGTAEWGRTSADDLIDTTEPGLTVDLALLDLRPELVFGEFLAHNWCTDLLTDPEPQVAERWTVVAGQVTFPDGIPAREGDPVTGHLSGLVATSEDGRTLHLPDMEVTNDAWGFRPG